MKLNNRYLIKTQAGYKPFDGIKRTLTTGLKIVMLSRVIECTNNHLICVGKSKAGKIFRKARNIQLKHKIKKEAVLEVIVNNNNEYYYDPVNVKDCHSYISQDVTHHNCLYLDEVAWVKTNSWEDFSDSVFPAQGALAWKKTILTSTMKGLNHWYQIVQKAKTTSEYNFHEAKWFDVPRYDKQGNVIAPEDFMASVIEKHGILYWNQNYLNEAIGSSHTLISADKLKNFSVKEPQEIWDGKLKIYHKPQKGHQYILSVDPAKDGIDAFSVQITDITDFKFIQAASAKIQIDYLLMPEFLDEWGRKYNNALILVENNEGAGQSTADQLYQTYEYENLYFDKDQKGKKKRYPGFRTTPRSRKLILNTMKTFIESDNLEISDKDTIQEFFTFILKGNKYQADDSCHDDMIMSLALSFGLFCNTKNFEDMKKVVEGIFGEPGDDSEDSDNRDNFSSYLNVGSFDDGTAENEIYSQQVNSSSYTEYQTYEHFIMEQDGFS